MIETILYIVVFIAGFLIGRAYQAFTTLNSNNYTIGDL